jgi:hypothetical protein
VSEQAIRRSGVWSAVLQKVDVEAAIVVKIKERGPRTNRLRHEITSHGSGIVNEMQTAGFRDIEKPGRVLCLFGWQRKCRPLAAKSRAGEREQNAKKSDTPGQTSSRWVFAVTWQARLRFKAQEG